MAKLTKRQQEILDLIRNHLESHCSPPTRAEIAKLMGFKSPNAAEDHLRALARKGAIELVPGTSRGIKLTIQEGIPVIARSIGTLPLNTEEAIVGHIDASRLNFSSHVDVALKVGHHNQNRDLGIFDGDLLFISLTAKASLDNIVVLKTASDIIARRYSQELLHVDGVVVGLIRAAAGFSLKI